VKIVCLSLIYSRVAFFEEDVMMWINRSTNTNLNRRAVTGASLALLLAFSGFSTSTLMAQQNELTIVLSEEPDIVDPCEATRSNVGRIVKQNVSETLTEINPENGVVGPRLATSWEQVDDTTWNFSLREGVTFHDGSPFNAEAVVHSINRALNPELDCEIRIKFFGGLVVTPEAIDEYTVQIKTDQPVPILATMMGTMTAVPVSTPMGERTREPIGTGPYRFAAWNVGESVVLERIDDYWGEQPAAEKATYIFRSESQVRAAMVETGEADIAPNIAVQDATNAETDFSYPNSETSRLRIDVSKAPLDDRRVREALNLAIDRDAIRGSIFSEDVIPATQLVVPGINGHNGDLQVWGYDPEKAKVLLSEAKADGVAIDTPIQLIGRINIYPNATEVMEAIMAMYQGIGLNVELKMIEVAEWVDLLTKPYAEDRPPIIQQSQHDNNNGDAVFTVFNKYHSDGGQSVLSDSALDDIIVNAGQATGDDRTRLFQDAFRFINDDIIADVPMYHMVGYTRVNPRLSFTPSLSTNSELQLSQVSFK